MSHMLKSQLIDAVAQTITVTDIQEEYKFVVNGLNLTPEEVESIHKKFE